MIPPSGIMETAKLGGGKGREVTQTTPTGRSQESVETLFNRAEMWRKEIKKSFPDSPFAMKLLKCIHR